jgi:hypothetical protein
MDKIIKKYYPNAEEGKTLTKKCMDTLTGEHGFDTSKTIMATSVCSDEIIRSSTNFRDYLGIETPFSLGGLAGFPFAGLTGLGAFCAHIPDDGFAILVYGPHIGFTKEGELGYVHRIGQKGASTCCGALKASVSAIEEKSAGQRDQELDYQQWKLEDTLLLAEKEITGKDAPLYEATEQMYHAIDTRIKKLLEKGSASIQGCTIALVGGIIINTDHELPDWFDLRELSVHTF